MLYLTRKIGESVVINENIRITVVEAKGKSIKLGFEFPSDVSVLRQELHERIRQENEQAATFELTSFFEETSPSKDVPHD